MHYLISTYVYIQGRILHYTWIRITNLSDM